MYKEFSGKTDINISHDLSRRINIKKDNILKDSENDLFITLKNIEMGHNTIKGA